METGGADSSKGFVLKVQIPMMGAGAPPLTAAFALTRSEDPAVGGAVQVATRLTP